MVNPETDYLLREWLSDAAHHLQDAQEKLTWCEERLQEGPLAQEVSHFQQEVTSLLERYQKLMTEQGYSS